MIVDERSEVSFSILQGRCRDNQFCGGGQIQIQAQLISRAVRREVQLLRRVKRGAGKQTTWFDGRDGFQTQTTFSHPGFGFERRQARVTGSGLVVIKSIYGPERERSPVDAHFQSLHHRSSATHCRLTSNHPRLCPSSVNVVKHSFFVSLFLT